MGMYPHATPCYHARRRPSVLSWCLVWINSRIRGSKRVNVSIPTSMHRIFSEKWPATNCSCDVRRRLIIPSAHEVEGGHTDFTLSVSSSADWIVSSVSSTILAGSISYLHILSSNFRRCVTCTLCFKIRIFGVSGHKNTKQIFHENELVNAVCLCLSFSSMWLVCD